MRLIAVTGTDTGIGKTVAVAALAACAVARGQRVAVVKPVQTGAHIDEPGDVGEVSRLTGVTDLHEYARSDQPLAPGTAARRCGLRIPSIASMSRRVRALDDRDLVLVEGAGGLLVELTAAGDTFVDLLAGLALDLPVEVLLVAPSGLGALNSATLTARALAAAALPLTGIVVGAWPTAPNIADCFNISDFSRYTGADVVGVLPAGSNRLNRSEFAAAAAHALSPPFGGLFDTAAFVRSVEPPASRAIAHSLTPEARA